jgi:hypothetical protein
LLPELERGDEWINISVPDGTVVNSEQENSAGSGIQLPLL